MTTAKQAREDHDLIIELKSETRNQTKTLDEHTSVLKSIQKGLQDIQDTFDKRISEVEARKLDRTEANRLQSESLEVHTKMQEAITVLQDAHKEMLTTLKVLRAILSIIAFVIAAVVIPLAAAYVQSAHWFR